MDQRWLKVLVYGNYGKGKTTLAGSSADVPQMRDVLAIDAEAGDLAYEDNPRIQHPDYIEHVRVTTFIQVARVHEFLRSHCIKRDNNDVDGMRRIEAWLKGCNPQDIKEPRRFRTVIIDSLSEVEAYCAYELMKVDEGTVLTGSAEEIDVMRFDEFRKNNMKIQMVVRAFRDLPMHVILVCSQQYTQDERKRFHYGPMMTGKLSGQIQGFVDIVGYLLTGVPDERGIAPRRLYVQPIDIDGQKFDAKNRRAAYPNAYFEDPTMDTIMRGVGLLK